MSCVPDAQRHQRGRAKGKRETPDRPALPCEAWPGAQGCVVTLTLATWPEGLQGCWGWPNIHKSQTGYSGNPGWQRSQKIHVAPVLSSSPEEDEISPEKQPTHTQEAACALSPWVHCGNLVSRLGGLLPSRLYPGSMTLTPEDTRKLPTPPRAEAGSGHFPRTLHSSWSQNLYTQESIQEAGILGAACRGFCSYLVLLPTYPTLGLITQSKKSPYLLMLSLEVEGLGDTRSQSTCTGHKTVP